MDEKSTPHDPKPHVVVLGGGLAGMAAACHLLDYGYPVTLVEKRPFLGGRAFSFFYPFHGQQSGSTPVKSPVRLMATSEVPQTSGVRAATDPGAGADELSGCHVDNGQHVFLGCCGYYIDFLKKLGTFNKAYLQPKFRVKVLSPSRNGRRAKAGVLTEAPLPSPFHLGPSFLLYPHIGIADKILAIYGLVRIMFADRRSPRLERQSFYQWLKEHRQTERSIENFWNLLVLPSLNDHVRDVSAAMGLMIFQEGVMKSRDSANVGYSTVGLSALMGDAAMDYILRKGGTLLLGKRVTRLILADSGESEAAAFPRLEGAELAGGGVIRGDLWINALPFNAFASVLPRQLIRDPFFRGAGELSSSPIVNIHVWYDRPVMDSSSTPFVAFLDSPLQWVFDKSGILGTNGVGPGGDDGSRGQYICISISGAWDYINKTKQEITEIFLQAMVEAFPQAAEASVEQLLVVKSAATFRCTPGAASHRPATETPVENLFLAGDWTDTGWPSTMEGAVRSGVAAAKAVESRTSDG